MLSPRVRVRATAVVRPVTIGADTAVVRRTAGAVWHFKDLH